MGLPQHYDESLILKHLRTEPKDICKNKKNNKPCNDSRINLDNIIGIYIQTPSNTEFTSQHMISDFERYFITIFTHRNACCKI